MAEMQANESDIRLLAVLRVVAMVVAGTGAGVSLGLMMFVGRRNDSQILLVLFGVWVLCPYFAMVLASLISRGWSPLTRITLYSAMLVVTLGSVAVYTDVALSTGIDKPAAPFLVVPLASWLLMAVAVPLAAVVSGRMSKREK